MLKTIRDNHGELAEINGCALWEKRAWVQSLTLQNSEDNKGTSVQGSLQ
jgi:hypothetical protein